MFYIYKIYIFFSTANILDTTQETRQPHCEIDGQFGRSPEVRRTSSPPAVVAASCRTVRACTDPVKESILAEMASAMSPVAQQGGVLRAAPSRLSILARVGISA